MKKNLCYLLTSVVLFSSCNKYVADFRTTPCTQPQQNSKYSKAAELEKAKNQIITNQLRQRETSNGKALALGEAAVLLADPARVNTDLERLQAVGAEIIAVGGAAHALVADLSDENQIEQLAQETARIFGGIDLLVNNAGIFRLTPFVETSTELLDQMLALNLRGAFLLCRAVWPHFLERNFKISSDLKHALWIDEKRSWCSRNTTRAEWRLRSMIGSPLSSSTTCTQMDGSMRESSKVPH